MKQTEKSNAFVSPVVPVAGGRKYSVALSAALSFALLFTIHGNVASAADKTFITPAGTVDWNDDAAWIGGLKAGSGDTAWLTNNLGGLRTTTNGALNTTIDDLIISNTASAGRTFLLQLSNQNFTVVNTGTIGRNGALLLKDSGVASITSTAKFGNLVLEHPGGTGNTPTLTVAGGNFLWVTGTGTISAGTLTIGSALNGSLVATGRFGNLVLDSVAGVSTGQLKIANGNFLEVLETGTLAGNSVLAIGSSLDDTTSSGISTARFNNLTMQDSGSILFGAGTFTAGPNVLIVTGQFVNGANNLIQSGVPALFRQNGMTLVFLNSGVITNNGTISNLWKSVVGAGMNIRVTTGDVTNTFLNNGTIVFGSGAAAANGTVFTNSLLMNLVNSGLMVVTNTGSSVGGINLVLLSGSVAATNAGTLKLVTQHDFRNPFATIDFQVRGGGFVNTSTGIIAGEMLLGGSVVKSNYFTVVSGAFSNAGQVVSSMGTNAFVIRADQSVNTGTNLLTEGFLVYQDSLGGNGILENSGTILYNGGRLSVAVLTNTVSGVISNVQLAGGSMVWLAGSTNYNFGKIDTGSGVLTNQSVIVLSAGGQLSGVFSNSASGLIALTNGTTTLNGTLLNSGNLNTFYDGTLSGGTLTNLSAGVISSVSGGNLALDSALVNLGLMNVTNGTLSITPGIRNSTTINLRGAGALSGGAISNLSGGQINSVAGGAIANDIVNLGGGIINATNGLLSLIGTTTNAGVINVGVIITGSQVATGQFGRLVLDNTGEVSLKNGNFLDVLDTGTLGDNSVLTIGVGVGVGVATGLLNNLTMADNASIHFAATTSGRGSDALIVTGAFANTANNLITSSTNGMRLTFNNSGVVTNSGVISNRFITFGASTGVLGINVTTGNQTNTFYNTGTIVAFAAGINTVNGKVYTAPWDMNLVNAGSIVISNLTAATVNDHFVMQVLLNGSRAATNEMGGTISLVTTQRTAASSATIDFQVGGGGFVNRGVLSSAISASNDTFVGRTHLFTVTSGAFSNAPTGQVILGANNSISNALAIRADRLVNAGTNLINSGTLFYQDVLGGAGILENSGVVALNGGTLRSGNVTNLGGGLLRGSGTLAGGNTTFVNAGIVSNGVGETLVFNHVTLTNAAAGQIRSTGGTWIFAGTNTAAAGPSFINEGASAANFKFDAPGSTLVFTNALSYNLSAPSANLGPAFASTNNNFFVANLNLANGTLNMIPATGGAPGSRAFYVDTLTLQSGATALNLNGTYLYYRNPIIGNTAIISGGGGTFIQLGTAGSGFYSFVENGGTYNWNVGSSWDIGGPPGVGDFVFITNAITSATVITNRTASTDIQTLTMSNSVAFAHRLVLSNNTTVVGVAVLGSNAIVQIGAGTAAATFSNTTLTMNSGSQIILSNGTAAALNQLVVTGSFDSDANSTITMWGAAGATNRIDFSGTGLTFTNHGSLISRSGSNLVRVVAAANDGTVSLQGGMLSIQNAGGTAIMLSNSGTILLGGGDLEAAVLVNLASGVVSNHGGISTISGDFSNLGTFVVRNGGIVTNTGIVTFNGSSTGLVTGASSLWALQNTLNLQQGRLVVNGGTVTNSGAVNIASVTGGDGSLIISNGGKFFGVGLTVVGSINAIATGSVVLVDGIMKLTSSLEVRARSSIGEATLSVAGGSLTVTNGSTGIYVGAANGYVGTFTQSGGSVDVSILRVGGTSSLGTSTGTVWLTGGTLIVTNSQQVIEVGRGGGYGEINLSNGLLLADGEGIGNASAAFEPGNGKLVIVNGTNRFVVGGALSIGGVFANAQSTGDVFMVGTGLLDVSANAAIIRVGLNGVGNLTISNGMVLANQLTVAANAGSQGTLTMVGGNLYVTNVAQTATLIVGQSGIGRLILNGGTLTANRLLATSDVNSVISFNGGTLITSNATTALAADVVIASNANFNINGTWNMNGGTNFVRTASSGLNPGAVFIGTGVSNAAVNVNRGAIWNLGTNGGAAMALLIGNANTTGNVLRINGGGVSGGALVTNVGAASIGGAQSASRNSLIITNGGRLYSTGIARIGGVGGTTTTGDSNTVIIVGGGPSAVSIWDLGSGQIKIAEDQNAGGSYNSITVDGLGVSGGAILTNVFSSGSSAGALEIGFYAGNAVKAEYNSVTVRNGGKLFVDGSGAGGNIDIGIARNNNSMLVDGGTLVVASSSATGGRLTVGSGLAGGSVGDTNSFKVSNGGYASLQRLFVGGRLGGSASNTVTVAGVNALGSNSIINLNGGSLDVGFNVFASNNVVIVGSGGVITNAGFVGVGGSGHSGMYHNGLIITNGGSLFSGTVTVGDLAGSSNNFYNVGGGVTRSTVSNNAITIGSTASGFNTMTVTNASLLSGGAVNIGNGSSNNTVTLLANSTWDWLGNNGTIGVGAAVGNSLTINRGSVSNAGTVTVGGTGNANALTITNQGALFTSRGTIGNNGNDNTVLITGGGVWSNDSVFYAGGGTTGNSTNNSLTISAGGKLFNSAGTLGASATSKSNSVRVTGNNSIWSTNGIVGSGSLTVGGAGQFNSLTISNAGKVFNNAGAIGSDVGGNSNWVTVTGANSIWNNASRLTVGDAGAGNTLTISSGGAVLNASSIIGNTGSNNTVTVTGNNSTWQTSGNITNGAAGATNRLFILAGGQVVASNLIVGGSAAAVGNVVSNNGGGLFVTNALGTGSLVVGLLGQGSYVASGFSTTTVDRLIVTNSGANLNNYIFNGGLLNTRTTQVANAATFVVGNGSSAATLNLLGGGHSFSNGLRVAAAATLNVTNTSTVTTRGNSNVTINGALFVGGGATLSNLSPFLINEAGGVITANNGGLVVSGTFTNFGNVALVGSVGTFTSPTVRNEFQMTLNASTLNASGAVLTNSSTGIINLNGSTIVGQDLFNAGRMTSTGGLLSNALANSGYFSAVSGVTTATPDLRNFGSGVITNAATFQIGSTGSGTVTNAGRLVMTGGTLLSGQFTNTGTISGFGAVNSSSVLNSGMILANSTTPLSFGGTLLVNEASGIVAANNAHLSVSGVFTNNGTLNFLNSLGTFSGTVVNNGAWITDPTTIHLTTFSNGPTGIIQMSAGDRYVFTRDFLNQNASSLVSTTHLGKFVFAGDSNVVGKQTMQVAGLALGGYGSSVNMETQNVFFSHTDIDTGTHDYSTNNFNYYSGDPIWGFTNNWALAGLEVGSLTITSELWLADSFASLTHTAGLYVSSLTINPGSRLVISNNVHLYFGRTNALYTLAFGSWNDNTSANILLLPGAGYHLMIVPEPNVLILWLSGALTLYYARRRRRLARP